MSNLNSIVLTPNDLISQLKVFDLAEFLRLDLPPRELILNPWLPKSGLCMLHAYRGIGKTYCSLGIAYAVATGGNFLSWEATKPRGVLFIDGEMPGTTLQARLAKIVLMHGHSSIPGTLRIITPDLQTNGFMPDIASIEGQEIVNQYISDDIDLIILDNISCLVRSGKENDSSDWMPIQTWALSLRARGKSVLMIHHSGKNGSQRGCSKREDVLDTVIALERPTDYQPNQGARFIVKYEKARGFFGEDAKPFEAQFLDDGIQKPQWKTQKLEDSTYQRVVTLLNEGMTQKEIADELDIHKSSVSRHRQRAIQEGILYEKK